MKRISSETDERIIEFWFQGLPRDTIARRVNVSGSTVSSVIATLPKSLSVLRLLSVELRKLKVSSSEAVEVSKLLSKLVDLNVKPEKLKEAIQVVVKLSRKEGYRAREVMQTALKLSDLEKHSGKSYIDMVEDFRKKAGQTKRLENKIGGQRSQVSDLKREIEEYTETLEGLKSRSEKPRKVLVKHDRTLKELAAYGLKPDDFEKIKIFLSEIQRLKGNPAEAVKILDEIKSLENKRQEMFIQLEQLKNRNETEERRHKREVERLEEKLRTLKISLTALEGRLAKRERREFELIRLIKNLRDRAEAEGQRVDGLLQTQAQLLKVQPDIDVVSEALPACKKELEQVEQQLRDKRSIIERAQAFSNLCARKPYDRKSIVELLQIPYGKAYGPLDDSVRQQVMGLMAEQGFVPAEKLEEAKNQAEKSESDLAVKIKYWKLTAERRSKELEVLKGKLDHKRAAKDKELDESINDHASNIFVEFTKRFG